MHLNRRSALQRILALGAAYCGFGCRAAPLTQRRQFVLLPEKQELVLGQAAYQEVIRQTPQSTNQRFIETVNRVGLRLAEAASQPDYAWEFRVLAAPVHDVLCLPGGKVAVWEGILPACVNEAGLAAVMSHQIAHAIARHGGERMSQNDAVEGVRQTLSYVTRKQSPEQRTSVLQAYGVASNAAGILPYSHQHEAEADQLGVRLMGQAGYDPAEAPRFWTRLGNAERGAQPSPLLALHPLYEGRVDDLQQVVPQAVELYAQAPDKHGLGATILNRPPADDEEHLAARSLLADDAPPPAEADLAILPEPIELPLLPSPSFDERWTLPNWVR
jgi:metalloendopeptidase OMA1, mitochondrial